MEITLKLLGGRLKEMRKALDMLQEDVAKHLDVYQNAISRIENGQEGELMSFSNSSIITVTFLWQSIFYHKNLR